MILQKGFSLIRIYNVTRFSLIRNLFVSRISFNQYQISGQVRIKRIDQVHLKSLFLTQWIIFPGGKHILIYEEKPCCKCQLTTIIRYIQNNCILYYKLMTHVMLCHILYICKPMKLHKKSSWDGQNDNTRIK